MGRQEIEAAKKAEAVEAHRVDLAAAVIAAIDERCIELKLSKAELARRAEILPQALRRMISLETPNPTLHTLLALTDSLDMDFLPRPSRSKPLKRHLGESKLQHKQIYNRLHDS